MGAPSAYEDLRSKFVNLFYQTNDLILFISNRNQQKPYSADHMWQPRWIVSRATKSQCLQNITDNKLQDISLLKTQIVEFKVIAMILLIN